MITEVPRRNLGVLPALTLLGLLTAVAHTSAQERILPKPRIVQQRRIEGRRVVRYEHDSTGLWGYKDAQTDYFYVIPAKSTLKHAPLRVVLHSAGHSGDAVLSDAFKHRDWFHYYSDDDCHVLYLDCQRNRARDWWWGYHEIRRHPELYKGKLTPTEARVLSTIEWVIRKYEVDRNRVYLSGISMGGSGGIGIGLCRGDVFAAISVAVPAGVEHMEYRMADGNHPAPPVLVDYSSHIDRWSKGQERLLACCEKNKYPIVFAWGLFGHNSNVSAANPAVQDFPWLSIRRNEAYPVFTRASIDDKYPGFGNKKGPDQKGQINGYFRWKNIEDTKDVFLMELRLVKKEELGNRIETPERATADVTPRRVQKFPIVAGDKFKWAMTRDGKTAQSGQVQAGAHGLLTIPGVIVTADPSRLILRPGNAAAR